MKTVSHRIIHFRYLQHDLNSPVSMREFRALREEVNIANDALEGVTSLRFPQPELSPYGGFTVVVIKNNETQEEWFGVAKCNFADRFVRREGVRIALAKANLAMTEGVDNVDEIEFFSNSLADRRLFHYLRDNELIRDDLADVLQFIIDTDRQLRIQEYQESTTYFQRQQRHAQHLEKQRQRSEEWHKTYPKG